MAFSKIIAGTMTWGEWGKNLNSQEIISKINFCIEQNITTFDHADIYGGYTTEAAFGNAFLKSGINRDKIQLISKCGIQYVCDNRNNNIKHYNYNKDYIIWSVNNSLKNLQTDYLDLLLLHRPSPLMHPDEIAEAITILKKEGKIKSFGVSNFKRSQMELLSLRIDLDVNQIEFSLTEHNAMHDGTLDYMISNGIKPMAWSPLGSVFKETNEKSTRIKETLQKLTKTYHATEDQLLLAWILKHPSKITPVIGTTQNNRIKLASQAPKIELSLEDWFELLVSCQGHKVP